MVVLHISIVSTIAAHALPSEETRLTPRSLPTSARAKKDTSRIVSVRLAFSHEHNRYTHMRHHNAPSVLLSQLGTAGVKSAVSGVARNEEGRPATELTP